MLPDAVISVAKLVRGLHARGKRQSLKALTLTESIMGDSSRSWDKERSGFVIFVHEDHVISFHMFDGRSKLS